MKSTTFRFVVLFIALGFGASTLLDWRSNRPGDEEDDFVIIEPTQKPARTFVAKESPAVETLGRAAERPIVQQAAAKKEIQAQPVEPTRLELGYYMVSQEGMNELLSRSIAQDSSGIIASGIVPSVDSMTDVQKFVEMKLVFATTPKELATNKNIIYESAARKIQGLDDYAGLRIIIVPSRVNEDEAQFSVNLSGNFFDAQSEEAPSENEVRNFSTTFRLTSGEIGFVSGFLPHTPPKVTETDAFFTQGPLSVFKNEHFIENAAEFVIFFTVDGLENTP